MIEGLSLLLLLCLSAFFSGSETALVALSRARADALAEEGRPGAQSLRTLKEQPSRMLIAILIGNNLVNISASALATVLATRAFGSMGPGIAVGVLTIVILVFGEITPKSLAPRYSERISLAVSPVVLMLVRITTPISRLFEYFAPGSTHSGGGEDPTVTESELISMAGYGEEEGTIEESEKQLIERAFAFTDLGTRFSVCRRIFLLGWRSNNSTTSRLAVFHCTAKIPMRSLESFTCESCSWRP